MEPSENPYASSHYESSLPEKPAPLSKSNTKPVSAIVIGIIHLVFGIPGLLFSPFNFIMLRAIENESRAPNAAWDIMRDAPGYMVFYKSSLVLGVVMSIALIAAGVGLLIGKSWGRTLSIVYAIAGIIMTLVGAAVNYFFLFAPLSQSDSPEAIGGIIGGVVGLVLGPIYPIITLIFMNRASVVEYYRGQR